MTRIALVVLSGTFLLASCTGSSDDGDVTGESHWLAPCTPGQICEAGTCICGRCTVECADSNGCVEAGGTCTDSITCEVRVCAPDCQSDAECEANEACVAGQCQPLGTWICDGMQRMLPLADGRDVVTGPAEASGDSCMSVPNGASPAFCSVDGATADFVTVSQEPLSSICFPSTEGATVIRPGDSGDRSFSDNGAVVVFDPGTDGQPVVGEIRFEAERVALLGNGMDATTVIGNLAINGNTARVRGLTVVGDVAFEERANNGGLSFSRIRGDLTINGNGVAVFATEVHGAVRITSEGVVLVGVGVAGIWEPQDGTVCEACYQFDDLDNDGSVEEGEIVGVLTSP